MFVPGVNGSVIPNVPSGSRLKGAYKNSKSLTKRKMPNGGSTGLGLALEAATYVPGPIGTYASGASALSNLYQGDYVGAGLDALNMATFGTAKGLMGVARAANAIRPYSNLALNAAQASRAVNKVGKKVAPVTRAAGTINEFNASNSTMRTPQRDNAQVQFRPNPNMRRMPNGGSVSVDNVSPDGSVDYSYSPSFKSLRGKLQGSTNILSGKQNYITPSVGASYKNFNLDYTPGNVRASIMSNKLNLDAEANFDKSKLLNSAVSGNYQVNPNLSVYGNVNYTPKEPVNYGVGFRYNKSFSEGGEVEDHDDDKEMVDGVASILRGVKSKSNRLQLANKLAKQFDREKVNYDLKSFLKKSKAKK